MTIHRSPSPIFLTTMFAACFLTAAGCTTLNVEPGSPVPARLGLQLRTATTDHRLTYFEVTHAGMLIFGGGPDAQQANASPVCKLTPEQMQAIWKIITTYHLFNAGHSGFFAKAQKVTYDLTLETSDGQRSIRNIDDQVPGLKELQDLLFSYQAQVRYKNVPGIK